MPYPARQLLSHAKLKAPLWDLASSRMGNGVEAKPNYPTEELESLGVFDLPGRTDHKLFAPLSVSVLYSAAEEQLLKLSKSLTRWL